MDFVFSSGVDVVSSCICLCLSLLYSGMLSPASLGNAGVSSPPVGSFVAAANEPSRLPEGIS